MKTKPLHSHLAEIIEHKRAEVEYAKKTVPEALLKERIAILSQRNAKLKKDGRFHLIAEIKKKSPSKGEIRSDAEFDPERLAREFEAAGASALSVLTDKFFGGTIDIFKSVRAVTGLPLLRKDFIIDPYQVYETKAMGADIILLIARVVTIELPHLLELALSQGLQVLIEVHDLKELKDTLEVINPSENIIIGVNNRNLETFETDLNISDLLVAHFPKDILSLSESGIQTTGDLMRMKDLGYSGVLVGEYLAKNRELLDYFKNEI